MIDNAVPMRRYSRIYITALAVLVVTLATAAWHMVVVDRLEVQRSQASERVLALFRIHREMLEAETAQRGFLLIGDIGLRDEFESSRRDVAQHFAAIADGGDDLRRLQGLGEQRMDALASVITVHDERGREAAISAVRGRVGAVLMEEYAALSQSIIDDDIRRINDIRERTASSNAILNLLLAAGGTIILVMVGISLAAQRRDLRYERAASEMLQKSGRRVSQLNELNNDLLSCRDQAEAYEVISVALGRLFPRFAGGVYAYRSSRDILELKARWGMVTGEPQTIILADECWGLRRGHVHQRRVAGDLVCRHWARPDDVRSVCVPMMAQGETVGLMFIQCVDATDEAEFFATAVQELAQTAASQVASAIANLTLRAALHQQSVKDPLTGLYNRRYLEESLQREVVRARRTDTPLAIVMVDVDHFKAFNDLHGHHAGDLILQRVGTVLAASVRGSDLACRYGGEEFTLVLPGAATELAAERAGVVREAIRRISVSVGGSHLPGVTASFGIAAFPHHGTDFLDVIQRADQALYRAKHEGRDRVVIAD